MPRVEYIEANCKSALNRVVGMPFRWSANPYTGCHHNCVFCFSRAYWLRADRGEAHEFSTRVSVKINFPDVLARELRRPSLRDQHVVLGTATDIYQPAEGRYRVTRRVLEVLAEHGQPFSMLTKSPLVLRDADILAAHARTAEVMVFFSITTLDLDLWRSVEPGTANPSNRLRVLRHLREAGVPAGVLMAPVLPGITDSEASIDAVARAAREHGATYFSAVPLRLMPGVKEYYLGYVAQAFPSLLPRYQRAYPRVHAPQPYRDRLQSRIDTIRAHHGFQPHPYRLRHSEPAPRRTQPSPPQLALPL